MSSDMFGYKLIKDLIEKNVVYNTDGADKAFRYYEKKFIKI